MNNRKYSIGFIIAGLVIMFLIAGAYQMSYQAALERDREERYTRLQNEGKEQESMETQGNAARQYCYYLLEENGYVVVYLNDKETVYEYTSIDVETLPVTVQNEVKNGKYIEDVEELYGFLENYSS